MPTEVTEIAQELNKSVDSLRQIAELGAIGFVVLFLFVILVGLLVIGLFLRGYNQRAGKQTDIESEQQKFEQGIWRDLKDSFGRIVTVQETMSRQQEANTANNLKTVETLGNVVTRLEVLDAGVKNIGDWAKTVDGTRALASLEIKKLKEFVIEKFDLLDPILETILSKLQSIEDKLNEKPLEQPIDEPPQPTDGPLLKVSE